MQVHILTTEWVLAEFGDAYCHPNDRADFVERIAQALGKPPQIIQKLSREAAELNQLDAIFAPA